MTNFLKTVFYLSRKVLFVFSVLAVESRDFALSCIFAVVVVICLRPCAGYCPLHGICGAGEGPGSDSPRVFLELSQYHLSKDDPWPLEMLTSLSKLVHHMCVVSVACLLCTCVCVSVVPLCPSVAGPCSVLSSV